MNAPEGEITSTKTPGHAPRPRVLLVDDDTPILGYLTHILEADYEVCAAEDGQAALDEAIRHAPDLVLTDVKMPVLDGFGLLKALRARPETASTPITLISGHGEEELRIEGMMMGADSYLIKPFGPRELLACVKSQLARAGVRRQQEMRERSLRLEAERGQDRLAFLAEASHLFLSAALDYKETLKQIAAIAVPRIADWCAVDLVEADGSLQRAATQHIDAMNVERVRELFRRFPPRADDHHGIGAAIRTGRAHLQPEITEELLKNLARSDEHFALLRQLNLASAMVVPLAVQQRVLGAITFVSSRSGRHFTADDLALAEGIAARAALAIDNARLHDEVQQANARLEERVRNRTLELFATNLELTLQVAARGEAEHSVRRFNEELRGLVRTSQELAAATDFATIFRITRLATRAVIGADGVTIVLRAGNECHYVDEDAIAPLWKGRRFPLGSCVSGWVMLHRSPAVIADVFSDARVPADAYRPTFVKSLAMVPMIANESLGAIGCYWAEPHLATPQQVELLELLASATARAIESVRAHGLLRESEEYYRTLIDAASDGIFVMDKRGRYTDGNAAGCAMLGYSREELPALRDSALMAPLQFSRVPEELTRLAVGKAVKSEWRIRRKDGTLFFGEISATLLPDGRRLDILRDTTERNQAEAKLRQSEREQRELARQLELERARLVEAQAVAKVGIWETELPGMTVVWSEETHRIFETDPGTFKPTHAQFLELVHPDDRAKVESAFVTSLRKKTRSKIEHRILLPDGRGKIVEEHWLAFQNEQGEPVRVAGTCQDITERKVAEEELLAYQRQYEILFRASPIAIGWGRLSDGCVVDVNRKCGQLFGYAREEMIGRAVADLGLWTDLEEGQKALALAATAGKVENFEARLRRKSGAEFEALISIERLRLGGEDMLVAMLVDVSERNHAQRELSGRALQQASLAALSRRAVESDNLSTLLDEAAVITARTLDAEFCRILELRPDRRDAKLVAGVGWHDGLVGHALVGLGPDSQAGFTLREDNPVVSEDLRTERRFKGTALLHEHDIRSGVSVVIGDHSHPWGVLAVHGTRPRAFSAGEISFLQSIADLLGTAIGRAHAEHAVRESERELRLIATATHDMLWNWDFATGTVTRSVGFQNQFGYPPEVIQPVIEWWVERLHPADRERVTELFRSAKEAGLENCSYQYRFRKHDGSYATVDDRVCILRDSAGRPVRALGAMKDVSERLKQHAAIRAISRQLLVAEETERRRIAKELHDSTVQGLVAAMMNLEFLREPPAGRIPAETRQIEDSLALLENCAHEIRTLSYLLHPPRLDDAGLAGAIRHYVAGFGERTGLATTVELPENVGRFDETLELVLFRVLQECLGNIHRHAQSKTVAIRLERKATSVVLEVADRGCGISAPLLAAGLDLAAGLGVGIPGMRERLRQIDGELQIDSSDQGTIVRAVAPLTSAPA